MSDLTNLNKYLQIVARSGATRLHISWMAQINGLKIREAVS